MQVTRTAWTCEPCRRRKVRCDRKDPCTHCQRRHEPCTWAANVEPERVRSPRDTQTLNELLERVTKIESVLNHAGLTAPSPSPPRETIQIEDLAEASPAAPLQTDLQLHDNFDHQIITEKETPRSSLRASQIIKENLPTREECDDLIESYLLNVEWIHHPLNVPLFRRQYDDFIHGQQSDTQWASLLFVMLCLGSHFHPTPKPARIAERFFAASNELLILSNHLANHSLTAITTLMLMGLWLNDRGKSNMHHAQLALAIKMAVSLGLGKLDAGGRSASTDAEFFSLTRGHQPTSVAASPDIELTRKLWWSLVCQDYYTASSCNFTYTIHPKQSKTYFFLNLDDEEKQEQSIHRQATAATYQLVKIPFARIAKAQVDLYNDDALTYEAVLDLEVVLWKTYADLPEYFKWDPHNHAPFPASPFVSIKHLEWQRIFLGFTVHNRVLRLHRPFVARSYADSAMSHSRTATLRSATACLELAEHGISVGFPGLRWWVTLVHLFTTGVVFCVELRFVLSHDSGGDVFYLQQQIDRLMAVLRASAKSSIAAQRAIKVLERLSKQAEVPARAHKRRKVTDASLPPARSDVSSNTGPSPVPGLLDSGLYNLDGLENVDWDKLMASLASEDGGVDYLDPSLNSF